MAAGAGFLAIEAGAMATIGAIANEIKDEFLSYITGGASDVLDAGKIITKGIKKLGTFKADRSLPRKIDGTPDASADGASGAHTQLGKKDGRNGSYNQAREFDVNGNVVKDVDFTDDGRPGNHSNPHEHKYVPIETGGTPSRSKKSEPLNPNF